MSEELKTITYRGQIYSVPVHYTYIAMDSDGEINVFPTYPVCVPHPFHALKGYYTDIDGELGLYLASETIEVNVDWMHSVEEI